MIGCYVHHQGAGHLHRFLTWARHFSETTGEQVTGLSSLVEPAGWAGPWVQLPPDWTDPEVPGGDPTAGGALHWAPLGHHGLRARMQQVSRWLDEAAPELFVVDVSAEIALLARLHGVPVLTVALPGRRSDPGHQLGFAVSCAVVGFWPSSAAGMVHRADTGPGLTAVGALSRFDGRSAPDPDPLASRSGSAGPRRIVVLSGRGGQGVSPTAAAAIAEGFPDAEITELGGAQAWHDDPWQALCSADVVVTAAGQNSLAEVAASRTPAVVVAAARPHDEQQFTRRVITSGRWPAAAAPERDDDASGWVRAVQYALGLNGADWDDWCDGGAAARFTELLIRLRRRGTAPWVGAGL